MSINIDRIGHAMLRVRDLDEAERFYTMLGFKTVEKDREHGDDIFMAGPNEGHTIDLMEVEDREKMVPGPARGGSPNQLGIHHIAFRVNSWEDLKEAVITLRENGVEIARMINHGNQRSIYFNDPSNNALEIYWEYPTAKYLFAYGRGDRDTPFTLDDPPDPWVTWEGATANPGAWRQG